MFYLIVEINIQVLNILQILLKIMIILDFQIDIIIEINILMQLLFPFYGKKYQSFIIDENVIFQVVLNQIIENLYRITIIINHKYIKNFLKFMFY